MERGEKEIDIAEKGIGVGFLAREEGDVRVKGVGIREWGGGDIERRDVLCVEYPDDKLEV